MRISLSLARAALCATVLLVSASSLSAGEKKLMHCFYFTAIPEATEADWQAFYKATDALPEKVPGLTKVWYGKLSRDATLLGTDRETYGKLATATESVTGPITKVVRQYGVCMEFSGEDALKAYGPLQAHKDWEAAYFKVRKPGTTSFNFMGK